MKRFHRERYHLEIITVYLQHTGVDVAGNMVFSVKDVDLSLESKLNLICAVLYRQNKHVCIPGFSRGSKLSVVKTNPAEMVIMLSI